MNGCNNCAHCKCYPGDRWTPDEYECTAMEFGSDDYGKTEEEWDKIMTRVWENGEEWNETEEPICPAWEENTYDPEDEYWDKYSWEENHYDKDERY